MESPLYRDEAFMRMREQMDKSNIFLGLATPGWFDDPLCWAQLGYAIMKDKPIYLLVQGHPTIPDNLLKCAKGIERFNHDEDMELAMNRLYKKIQSLL